MTETTVRVKDMVLGVLLAIRKQFLEDKLIG